MITNYEAAGLRLNVLVVSPSACSSLGYTSGLFCLTVMCPITLLSTNSRSLSAT